MFVYKPAILKYRVQAHLSEITVAPTNQWASTEQRIEGFALHNSSLTWSHYLQDEI